MKYGRTIQEYHIGRLLGRGSFGDVYEATCCHSSNRVAIKMISKQLLQNQGMMDRVVREVEIHCQLRHPHIVELFEYFEDVTRVYFVMELCSRGELLTLLREKGRVDLESAKVYFSQLVSGVEYLHSQSILHRDLKLSNLLLTRDCTLKIADFGLAAALAGGDSERRTICGTPNYMCPEIVAHEPYTLAADLWSLGVTLYTFLTGSPPFQSDAVQGTLQRVGDCDYQCPSDMPPDAAHLISQLLQKDPKRRLSLSAIKKHPFLSSFVTLPASMNATIDRREGPRSPDTKSLPRTVDHSVRAEAHPQFAHLVQPTRAGSNERGSSKNSNNHFLSQEAFSDPGAGSSDDTYGVRSVSRDRVSRVKRHGEGGCSQRGEEEQGLEAVRRAVRREAELEPVHGGRAEELPEGEEELVEGELQEMGSSAGEALGSLGSLDGMLCDGPEGRTLPTKPLSTTRLRPLRHEMVYGSLSILEDGQVCVEHQGGGKVGVEEGQDGVGCCLFYVSRDGLDVRVERPGRAIRHHRFPFLPEALVGHYAHAAAFVAIVAAATPKVVYVSERAQATCMENGDLQVAFIDRGPIISVHMSACNGSASVVAADGAVYTLPSLHSRPSDVADGLKASALSTKQSPGSQDKVVWDALSHARRCHRRCTEAEARALAQNPAKSFPLVARSRRLKSSSRPPLSDTAPLPNATSSSHPELSPPHPESAPHAPLKSHPPLSESLRSLALSSSRPFPTPHIVQSIQQSVAYFANNSSGSLLSGDLSSGSSNSSSSFHVPQGVATPPVAPPPLPPRRLKPLQSPVSPLSPNPSMQSGPSDRSMPCSPLGAGLRSSSTAGYPRGSHDSSSACAPADVGADHSMGSGPRVRPHVCSSSDEHNWLSANGSGASGSLTGSDVPSHSRKSWPADREIHSGGETELSGGWSGEGFRQSQRRSARNEVHGHTSQHSHSRRGNADTQEQCVHTRGHAPRTQSAAWDQGEMVEFSGRPHHQDMPPQHGTRSEGILANGTERGWELRWRGKGCQEVCVPGVPANEGGCRRVQTEIAKDNCHSHCLHCQSGGSSRGQHLYGGCGHCQSCGELRVEERERRGHTGCAECGSHSRCCSLRYQDRRATVSWAGRGQCSVCGENPSWEHGRGGVDFDSRHWEQGQHLQVETAAVCWTCAGQGRHGRSSMDVKGQKGSCVACDHRNSGGGRQRGAKEGLISPRGTGCEMREGLRPAEGSGRVILSETGQQGLSPSPVVISSRLQLASLRESSAEGRVPPEASADVQVLRMSSDRSLPSVESGAMGAQPAEDLARQREQLSVDERVTPSQRVPFGGSVGEARSSRDYMLESSQGMDRPLGGSMSASRIRAGNGVLQEESRGVGNHSPPAATQPESPAAMRSSRPEAWSPSSRALVSEGSGQRSSRESGAVSVGESMERDRSGAREMTLEELRQSGVGGAALESQRQSAYFPGVGWAIRLPSGELLMHYLDDAQMVVTADGASVEYWSPGGAATGQRYDLTVRNSIPSEVKAKLQHLAAFIRLLKKQPSPSTSQAGAEVSHEYGGR